MGREFTAEVSSGGILNIPKTFADMNDIEQGDKLEVQVKRHKKSDGETVYESPEATQ